MSHLTEYLGVLTSMFLPIQGTGSSFALLRVRQVPDSSHFHKTYESSPNIIVAEKCGDPPLPGQLAYLRPLVPGSHTKDV